MFGGAQRALIWTHFRALDRDRGAHPRFLALSVVLSTVPAVSRCAARAPRSTHRCAASLGCGVQMIQAALSAVGHSGGQAPPCGSALLRGRPRDTERAVPPACSTRLLHCDHATFGQHSWTLAVRFAGTLGLLRGGLTASARIPELSVKSRSSHAEVAVRSARVKRSMVTFLLEEREARRISKLPSQGWARAPVEESIGTCLPLALRVDF